MAASLDTGPPPADASEDAAPLALGPPGDLAAVPARVRHVYLHPPRPDDLPDDRVLRAAKRVARRSRPPRSPLDSMDRRPDPSDGVPAGRPDRHRSPLRRLGTRRTPSLRRPADRPLPADPRRRGLPVRRRLPLLQPGSAASERRADALHGKSGGHLRGELRSVACFPRAAAWRDPL